MNFKHMHPAAVFGFLACVAVALVFQQGLKDPATIEALSEIMTAEEAVQIAKMFWWIIAFQGLGLVLVALRSPLGLIVAIGSGFFMLPLGFVYIAGCLLSHNAAIYEPFAGTLPNEGRPLAAYLFQNEKNLSTSVMVLSIAGAAIFFMMDPLMGLLLIGAGTFCLFIVKRIRGRFVLALYDSFFTYMGGFFAKDIKVPYSAVRAGSLISEDKVRLEVGMGDRVVPLVVAARAIRQDDRRPALDALGRMLLHYNVPLS